MASINELTTYVKPQWCPGCGDYGILTAFKQALSELNLDPKDVVLVSGIGCSGKFPHYINTYAFEAIHGRVLPVASGIKLANNSLTVIGIAGDGDGYGIGACHFIHTMRRNIDLTYIVFNNKVYGLTTGQASPTSDKGMKTKSTPFGLIELPLNPIAAALAAEATFIARAFAGDIPHLKEIIKQGIAHRGIALIDVLQPCTTFNKINTHDWYKQRVYKLEETGYTPDNRCKAWEKSWEWENTNGQKIPVGVFYKENRKTYEDELPEIQEKPLAKHDISKIDIKKLLEEMG